MTGCSGWCCLGMALFTAFRFFREQRGNFVGRGSWPGSSSARAADWLQTAGGVRERPRLTHDLFDCGRPCIAVLFWEFFSAKIARRGHTSTAKTLGVRVAAAHAIFSRFSSHSRVVLLRTDRGECVEGLTHNRAVPER